MRLVPTATLCLLLGLTACATRAIRPTLTVGNTAHVAATFRVPDGWVARTNLQYDPYSWALSSKNPSEAGNCSVGLTYRELWPEQTGDQQAQAENKLDGIRRHNDGKVVLSATGTFRSRAGEGLRVYRYFSGYWRDRRSVFVVRGNRCVEVSLYAHDPADAGRGQAVLEEIAASVAVP